jgi:mono/diheme cytochrome c family protein
MQTITAGRNSMPPFGATLSLEQIRDVSTYVVRELAAAR